MVIVCAHEKETHSIGNSHQERISIALVSGDKSYMETEEKKRKHHGVCFVKRVSTGRPGEPSPPGYR